MNIISQVVRNRLHFFVYIYVLQFIVQLFEHACFSLLFCFGFCVLELADSCNCL